MRITDDDERATAGQVRRAIAACDRRGYASNPDLDRDFWLGQLEKMLAEKGDAELAGGIVAMRVRQEIGVDGKKRPRLTLPVKRKSKTWSSPHV